VTTTYQRPFSGQLGKLATPVLVYTVGATQAVLKEIAASNVGGPGSTVATNGPLAGIAADSNGNLYWTEISSHVIKRLTPDGTVTIFAGADNVANSTDGVGKAARFQNPRQICIDSASTYMYVADGGNSRVRRVTLADATVLTIAGNGTASDTDNTTGTSGTIYAPTGCCLSPDGTTLYVTTTNSSGGKVRKIALTGTFALTTLAGFVPSATASPVHCCVDSANKYLYFTRLNSGATAQDVVRCDLTTGAQTVISGLIGSAAGYTNGFASVALFNGAISIAIDEPPNSNARLYVTDSSNNVVRYIDIQNQGGTTFQFITGTILGAGTNSMASSITASTAAFTDGVAGAARTANPGSIAKFGDALYFGGSLNSQGVLQRYDLKTGLVHRVAGTGDATTSGSGQPSTDGVAVINQTAYYNVYVVPSGQTLDTNKHCKYRNRSVAWQTTDVLSRNLSLQAGDKVYIEALSTGMTFDVSSLEVA
jgi:DNA-binding beta-propeller fold protein YncE